MASEGAARAVLPLQRTASRLEALGNWYSFTARPLFSPGASAERLLEAIARDLKGRTWRVTLAPLPDEDGSASMIETAFSRAGWRVERQACDVNHVLEVKGRSFAEYLASRPGPLRTMLARKSGKLEIALYRAFDPAAWADYEAVYAESWKPREGSPAFLRAFAEAEAKAGRLLLGVARAEGHAVAAQLWTIDHSTAFIHKLAHREEAKALSPGTVLSAALFEAAIDQDRVALVDFGTGDDPYKADWMEQVRPRYRLDCLDPRQLHAWPWIARSALRRLAGGE